MIDEREALERALKRFPPEPGIVDRVYQHRRRKDRNQRIGAGLVTVAVVTAVAVLLANAFGSRSVVPTHPTPVPPHPAPSVLPAYHHNGDIAVYGMAGSYDRLCARSASMGGPVQHGCAIFEVNPATGHEAPLPIGGIGAPGSENTPTDLTWSPDGMELAYVRLDGRLTIFHLSTGRSEDIFRCPPHTCELAWSADGTTIAISNGAGIDLVSPDGTEQASLEPLGSGAHIGAPAWLPDGRRIAFVDGSGLYEVDRTGAHLRHLGDIPKRAYAQAFSPDGSRIAYLVRQDCSRSAETACPVTLTVAPTDGSSAGSVRAVGKCACLGYNPGLGWSPDGKKLALVVPGAPLMRNADGIELVTVSVDGEWGDPAWRPVP